MVSGVPVVCSQSFATKVELLNWAIDISALQEHMIMRERMRTIDNGLKVFIAKSLRYLQEEIIEE